MATRSSPPRRTPAKKAEKTPVDPSLLSPKAEQKRQAILDAAARVLRRRGYAEATLGEIALEAGTHAGSLYYYFQNREALVVEVIGSRGVRLAARVQAKLAAMPAGASATQKLITVIRTHALTLLERDDYLTAYQKVYDQISEEMRKRISQDANREYANLWHDLISQAVLEGAIRPDYDVRLLRLLLVGSITAMSERYNPSGPSTPEEITDTIVRLYFEGAGTAAGRDFSARHYRDPLPETKPARRPRRV